MTQIPHLDGSVLDPNNSINLHTFHNSEGIPTRTIHIVGPNAIAHFTTLLQRALNTWDDAPAELKTLADEFIYGAPLQDYNNLAGSRSINSPLK